MDTLTAPCPLDLRARLAGCRAEVSAIVPALAGAVARYREAVALAEPALPNNIAAYDAGFHAFMAESGAGALRAVLAEVEDLVAAADWPTIAEQGARP